MLEWRCTPQLCEVGFYVIGSGVGVEVHSTAVGSGSLRYREWYWSGGALHSCGEWGFTL